MVIIKNVIVLFWSEFLFQNDELTESVDVDPDQTHKNTFSISRKLRNIL